MAKCKACGDKLTFDNHVAPHGVCYDCVEIKNELKSIGESFYALVGYIRKREKNAKS